MSSFSVGSLAIFVIAQSESILTSSGCTSGSAESSVSRMPPLEAFAHMACRTSDEFVEALTATHSACRRSTSGCSASAPEVTTPLVLRHIACCVHASVRSPVRRESPWSASARTAHALSGLARSTSSRASVSALPSRNASCRSLFNLLRVSVMAWTRLSKSGTRRTKLTNLARATPSILTGFDAQRTSAPASFFAMSPISPKKGWLASLSAAIAGTVAMS